jgi:hypothetical protein
MARETTVLSAQHLSRFDAARRLATLIVFAREMEAILTDAALSMFDKMLGTVCRRADRARKENVVERKPSMPPRGLYSAWRGPCWPPKIPDWIRSLRWSAPSAGSA